MIGTIAAVAAPLIGGVLGNIFSSKDKKEQARLLKEAYAQYDELKTPEMQKLIVENLQSQGQLTPELQQVIEAPESQMTGIQVDPQARAAQMQALEQLQGLGKGEILDSDLAQMQALQSDVGRQAAAREAATLQNMQRRGMAGSGQEMLARLLSGQESANRAAAGGRDLQAMVQNRALNAIQQAGNLGGNIEGRDFGQKSDIAQAQDLITRFNIGNARDVQSANVGAMNEAQKYNLAERQRIADANAVNRMEAQKYNNTQTQQQYNNQLGLANAKAGALGGQAGAAGQQAQNTAQTWSNIGSGVGQGVGAYGSAQAAQAAQKTRQDQLDFDRKRYEEKLYGGQ